MTPNEYKIAIGEGLQIHPDILRLALCGEEIPWYTVYAANLGFLTAEEIEAARRGEF